MGTRLRPGRRPGGGAAPESARPLHGRGVGGLRRQPWSSPLHLRRCWRRLRVLWEPDVRVPTERSEFSVRVAGGEKCQPGEWRGGGPGMSAGKMTTRIAACPAPAAPPASLPVGDRFLCVPCPPGWRCFSCLFGPLTCPPPPSTPTRRCWGHTNTWVSYLLPSQRDEASLWFWAGSPLGECGANRRRLCPRSAVWVLRVTLGWALVPVLEPGGGKEPQGAGPVGCGRDLHPSAGLGNLLRREPVSV